MTKVNVENSKSETYSVRVVWKPTEGSNTGVEKVVQMLLSLQDLASTSKLNLWKLETHMDGFGRPYVMLEITCQQSSTAAGEKSGSSFFVPVTSWTFSDDLTQPIRGRRSIHRIDIA